MNEVVTPTALSQDCKVLRNHDAWKRIKTFYVKSSSVRYLGVRLESETKLRVRFEETDTMHAVYYSKYFVWFEVGRYDLLRSVGLNFKDHMRSGLLHLPIVEAGAKFQAPLRFDDEVLIRTKVTRIGNSSIRFGYKVYKLPEKQLVCTGYTIHVMLGKGGKRIKVRDVLSRFGLS